LNPRNGIGGYTNIDWAACHLVRLLGVEKKGVLKPDLVSIKIFPFNFLKEVGVNKNNWLCLIAGNK
jgi:hypothetical protein